MKTSETRHRAAEEALQDWFDSELGRVVGRAEAELLETWLAGLFGYRLVQCGPRVWRERDPLAASPIGHKVLLCPADLRQPPSVVADSAQLPLASDSIDLIILPHTLDFSADPRQVLREADRVLIPGGRLITMGFNPWSLWGARRLLSKLSREDKVPWKGNFVGYMRLGDWLGLLGMEVERTEVIMFRPPLRTQAMLRRIEVWERLGRRFSPMLAGIYVVQAVKHVRTLTPIRPRRLRLRSMGNGALSPSTRTTANG